MIKIVNMSHANTDTSQKERRTHMTMVYKGKLLRIAKGLTQDQLSAESGVSRSIISGLESGRTEITTTKTLLRIAQTLGVGVNDLFCDADA